MPSSRKAGMSWSSSGIGAETFPGKVHPEDLVLVEEFPGETSPTSSPPQNLVHLGQLFYKE